MTTMEVPVRGAAWSDASAIAASVQQSVVMVRSRAGAGAGTAWRADGLVVTNSHVVRDGRVQIVTHDEQAHTARARNGHELGARQNQQNFGGDQEQNRRREPHDADCDQEEDRAADEARHLAPSATGDGLMPP